MKPLFLGTLDITVQALLLSKIATQKLYLYFASTSDAIDVKSNCNCNYNCKKFEIHKQLES